MKVPKPIKVLYALWMKFSHYLGLVMSTIILTILWIVGFGLYAIVWRIACLFAKKKGNETYWIPAEQNPIEHMRHPF